ncbi:MAG: dienelactone hydrolase family protein [Rubrivivax sp.]|nr:dienelactone hydrolase family protein [Rubrivivax sp.]
MPAAHSATSPSPAALPIRLSLDLGSPGSVSALLVAPPEPAAGFVLAHGAGAGMTHAFMEGLAQGMAERRIATLRYQFAYMERGSKRPDAPAVAHAAVRAAVAEAGRRLPGLPLVAGGKSFGARMTSQAQAASPLPGVRGLVFVGFPLHPASKPAIDRADHLDRVACPMLFLQGTRDELADLPLLNSVLARLGTRARLETFHDADHSFHVRASSGSNDAQVMARLLDAAASWIAPLAGPGHCTPPSP